MKSVSGLSVPHLDAFSEGLLGPAADLDQQIASQDFTVFLMENSASLNWNALYNLMGLPFMNKDSGFPDSAFQSAEEFQKAVWWYNGAGPDYASVLAEVPVMSASTLIKDGSPMTAAIRLAYPEDETVGAPAKNPIGKIAAPTLFVCGSTDFAILCDHEYSKKTSDYVTGAYEYLLVPDCGHDILACGDQKNTDLVIDAITRTITANE